MNCTQAKQINLYSYMKKIGFNPMKTKGSQAWFLSPFRSEKTPSFKVDTKLNVWYDFGEGSGGNIIDFVLKYHQCDINKALQILGSDYFSFQQQYKSIKNEPTYTILSVDRLKNNNLLSYIKSRKLNWEFAQQFCVEIHYTFDNINTYYGIGFKNNSNGYEIRNKYFKGCLGKKEITTINRNYQVVSLFESWTDFLSYLTLKKGIPKENFVILNSTSLVKKTIGLVGDFRLLKLFLDNDEAGNKATSFLIGNATCEVLDNRIHYKKFNDLNDYLIAKSK